MYILFTAFELFNSKDTCSVQLAHFFNAQNRALGKASCLCEKLIATCYFSYHEILICLPSNTYYSYKQRSWVFFFLEQMQEKSTELNNWLKPEMRPKCPLKSFLVNSHLMSGKSFAYYYAMQINKAKKQGKKIKSTVLPSIVIIYLDNSSFILIIHYSALWQSVNMQQYIFLS